MYIPDLTDARVANDPRWARHQDQCLKVMLPRVLLLVVLVLLVYALGVAYWGDQLRQLPDTIWTELLSVIPALPLAAYMISWTVRHWRLHEGILVELLEKEKGA